MKHLDNKVSPEKSNEYIEQLKDFDINSAAELPIEEALSKICVSKPYFAFNKIYKHKDFLISKVSPEQQKGNELGKITVGESGRHMAILGSVACGLKETSRHYYLAEKSHITNYYDQPSTNNKHVFIAMRSSLAEKRRTRSEGVILDENMNLTHDIYVTYHKIAPPLFKKFFNKHFKKTPVDTFNPYTSSINLKLNSDINNKLNITIPDIDNESCAGHFSGCPAVPIAFFMHNIGQLCSNYISKKNNHSGFVINEARLDLRELMFSGSLNKNINSSYEQTPSGDFNFNTEIFQNNKLSGNIFFSITLKE